MSLLTDLPEKPVAIAFAGTSGLRPKIVALRKRHVAVAMIGGLALVVIVALGLLSMMLFLDWWLELPWVVRLLALLVQIGAAGTILVRFVIRPFLQQPDDDDLALMVERKRPEFRTRLIAAVQLARPGALPEGTSRELAEATVMETEAMARPVNFPALVPTDKLRKLVGSAIAVIVVAMLGLGWSSGTAFDLLKRALLSRIPVPRKTQVIVHAGDRVLGRGDDLTLDAYARGVVPSRGRVDLRYGDRRAQSFALQIDRSNRTHFVRTIANVQESFNYVIYLNDGRSETYQVKALPRPTVAAVECQQDFPAYTGLPAVRRPLGDLTLLAGSRLRLQITATKPIRTASIKLVGSNVTDNIPLAVDANAPSRLTGEFAVPARGLTGFSIELLDQEGLHSKESAVYRVEIVPDKAPVVRITYPDRKEELATREAKLIVGMDVADEFQISRLTLRYKLDTDEGAAKSLELELDGQRPARLQRQFIWNWGGFSPLLPEGSVIEYWVEAQDNNDVTGPGVGSSDHQIARVVSESEKRADLLNRAGDAFSSITDAAADQELLNKRLGTIILEKSGLR